METPLVSICSITYNHAPFIRQCLDGFLMQQTNFPIEIIINDDCSTDGTTEIIREYAEKYPDKIFPIFHEENLYSQGVRGMAQKFVYPKARGKYIATCEGDDYWTDPLKLQKQVDFLESHPDYSMCCHKAEVVYEGVPQSDSKLYEHIRDNELSAARIMLPPAIPTASMMVRSVVARECPVHKDFHAGDVVLQAHALVKGRVFGMSEVMSVYRRHVLSWTYISPINDNYIIRSIPHFLAMMEVFPRHITKSMKRRLAFRCYLWMRHNFGVLPIRYLPKALYFCNTDLLFYFVMVPCNKMLRWLGFATKDIEPSSRVE